MGTLSSRPPVAASSLSDQELKDLAAPAVNVLNWFSALMVFPDDTHRTVTAAHDMIEEALSCFPLLDYVVMAAPSPYMHELKYDVAVKVAMNSPYVAFKVVFRVQP